MTRLFLLTGILLVTQAGFSQSYKEFIVREEGRPESIPVFPQYPKDAAIIFYSAIPNLVFESNTDGIVTDRSTAGENKYVLILKTETQTLTIKSPGFLETKLRVARMAPRDVKYYTIDAKIPSLDPETGDLILRTVPSGAKIEIDSLPSFSAYTPYTLTGFGQNRYQLRLVKSDYDTALVSVQIVQGQTLSKIVELTPRFGLVRLQTDEENELEINGQWIAFQPETPVRVPVGVSTIRVFRNYYLPFETTVETGPNDDPELAMDLPVSLVPDYGEWKLRLTPENSRIFINGKEVYPENGSIRIRSGQQKIRVFNPGYEDSTWVTSVRRLEEREVIVNLRRMTGKLQVTSEPDEASVYLDDQLIGYTPLFSESIPTDIYKLSVRKDTYQEVNLPITIKSSELVSRDVPLYRQALFTLTGTAGARFRLYTSGNQSVNITGQIPVYHMKLRPGDYNLIFDNPGYEPESYNFSVDQDDVKMDVDLTRTDGKFFRFALFGNDRLYRLYDDRTAVGVVFRKSALPASVMETMTGLSGKDYEVSGLEFQLTQEWVPFRVFLGTGINEKKTYFSKYSYSPSDSLSANGFFRYENYFGGISISPFVLMERISPAIVFRYENMKIFHKQTGAQKSRKFEVNGFSVGYEVNIYIDNDGVTPFVRFTYNPMEGQDMMSPQTTLQVGLLL